MESNKPRQLNIDAIIEAIARDKDLSSDEVRGGYVDEVLLRNGQLGPYLESLNALFNYVDRELPESDRVHLNVEEGSDISDLTWVEVNLVRTLLYENDRSTEPSTRERHTIESVAFEFDENELHNPDDDIRRIGPILNQISAAYTSVETRYLKKEKS